MNTIVNTLSDLLKQRSAEVDQWFAKHYNGTPAAFYSSVDLRHSGVKLAPVDTNLFPAGFNNLSAPAVARATQFLKDYLSTHYSNANHILLVLENHTRNLNYLDNALTIKYLIEQTGRNVTLTNLDPALSAPLELTSASGDTLLLEPISKQNGQLHTQSGVTPELIILNNDLTTGIPDILEGLSQPVIPSPNLGWHSRRKSTHFEAYNALAHDFAATFSIDPWLISTVFQQCGKVNFKEKIGLECVAVAVEKALHLLRQKYREHGITEEPYVFIKADNGTYGMGIMTARSGDDILNINKDNRKKMNVIKGGFVNTEVVIQEGIPTVDLVDGNTAEPFIYLVAGKPVGCIYRVNNQRSIYDNLNATGMTFEQEECETSAPQAATADTVCSYSALGLIARMASLATVKEEYRQADSEKKTIAL